MGTVARKRLTKIVQRTAYPVDAIMDTALAEIEEIAAEDGWYSRLPELGRAIWELSGVMHRVKFGDPDNVGVCPDHRPAQIPKLKHVESVLLQAKSRMVSPFSLSNNARRMDEVNEMVVLLDCCIRVLRLELTACQHANQQGTQDCIQQ